MPHLTTTTLGDLAPGVVTPGYDRGVARVGHAHIGVGNFHRAHQAVYADDLLTAGSSTGAIVGFSLRSSRIRQGLAPQDLLYTVAEMSRGRISARVIGSLRELVAVAEDPAAAIDRLVDPAIEVVTITVTEGGYHWLAGTGSLDLDDADVAHDLRHPQSPRTMPGLLVAALARRIGAGNPPFVVVPCDNLAGNGAVARSVLSQFAWHHSPSLGRIIESDVAFCSTMVDRMVPATTVGMAQHINAELGVEDAWPVATEPFRQWVIQDHPAVRRWAEVGVELVGDTADHERLKLRVLNGLHSAYAYLGLRLGHGKISDAVADPLLDETIRTILDDEILPGTSPPPGVDAGRYAQEVIDRFAEPALGYTTGKVASGGFLKLQQRLLPTLRASLQAGRRVDGLALVIAAWGWCMFGPRRADLAIEDEWLDSRSDQRLPSGGRQGFVDWALGDEGLLADLSGSAPLRTAIQRQAENIWRDPPIISPEASAGANLS